MSTPNTILYVGDVLLARRAVAECFHGRPDAAAQRKSVGPGRRRPRVTIAAEAIVTADSARNRQLSLARQTTYAARPTRLVSQITFPIGEQILEARQRGEVKAKNYTATPTIELMDETGKSLKRASSSSSGWRAAGMPAAGADRHPLGCRRARAASRRRS